jgi:anti-sigma factor RsiW
VNCHDVEQLLHGYVDGELDLMQNLEIDGHLQTCAACARAYADLQTLRASLKDGAPYFAAPPHLSARIQETLRHATATAPRRPMLARRWLSVAAALALVALASWGVYRFLPARSAEDMLAQEVVASHVRSQMLPGHLIDVEGPDVHKVKPFFEGKLDFPPPVPNLEKQNFRLIGGRLDYLNNRPVAALVYKRRDHVINLFVWPSTRGVNQAPRTLTRRNYNLVTWEQGDMTYWVISNLNETELREFVQLVQANATPQGAKPTGQGER